MMENGGKGEGKAHWNKSDEKDDDDEEDSKAHSEVSKLPDVSPVV